MLSRVTAAFLLLGPSALLFQQQTPPPGTEKAESNVSQIRTMKAVAVQIRYLSDAQNGAPQGIPLPPKGERAGTGFFVSQQGYVLTAAHVIRGAEKYAREKGATKVWFQVGILLDPSSVPGINFLGSFSPVAATPVEVDDVHDVALLKLSANPFNGQLQSGIKTPQGILPLRVAVARLKPELPPEGRNVLISGYPLEIPTFVTQKGMVASESFSIVTIPVPGAIGRTRPEAVDSILLDAVVNPGNSGGPVYESDSGDVVGICEAYELSPLFTNKLNPVQVTPDEIAMQNAGLAVVVPIKYGIDLLRKNGVTDYSTK